VKLGIRFALFLLIPLVGLTALIGWWHVEQGRRMLREELKREGRAIAFVTQSALEDYVRDRQFADLRHFVDGITGYERVLGLRLFDRAGRISYQSNTLDAYPFQHDSLLRQVLASGEIGEMRRQIGQLPVLGYICPLEDSTGVVGAVQVLQLESFIQEDERASQRFIVTLSLTMVVAILVIVWLVTRYSVTRPIAALIASFREVGAREHPTRVPVHGDDELARLAREFNGMCERLEAARASLLAEQEERRRMEIALRDAERLAGLGRLAAGLAHEIGTPLNVIGGRTEALLRTVEGQDAAERNLRIISTQIDRIARTVRDMLDFARMKPAARVDTDLEQTLDAVLELLDGQLEQRGIRVERTRGAAGATVHADPDQLQQVFLNVIVNAMDAMESGGTLRVRTSVEHPAHPEDPGRHPRCVAIVFEDTGTGIPDEHLPHVFDPFFTTKEVGRGTGLGLSVSYGIVRDHGGWFDIRSEVGRGTAISVMLPAEPVDGGPG